MTLDSDTSCLLRRGAPADSHLPLPRGDGVPIERRWGVQVFEDEQLRAIVPLDRDVLSAGRDPACLVRLADRSVSRLHCTLTPAVADVLVQNLSTTNGTIHLGQRIERSRIRLGEEVFLGRALLRLVDLGQGEWLPGAGSFDALYRDRSSGLLNPRGFWLHAESRATMAHARTSRSLLIGQLPALADSRSDASLLARTGQLVRSVLPGLAVAGRIGHDTFGLFALDLEYSELCVLAEQLGRGLRTIAGSTAQATTLGAAIISANTTSLGALHVAADEALQRARMRGNGCEVTRLALA